MRLFIVSVFAAMSLHAQFSSTAYHIAPGASLPATCSPNSGDVWFKTAATIGMYQCLTANTWTAVGGGGGGGITGSGGVNQVTYWSSASAVTGSASLQWINTAVSTPTAPVLTKGGAGTGSTWGYEVVCLSVVGPTVASAEATISGNATLDATHTISIATVVATGCSTYDIYRTTSGGTPSGTGKIGNVAPGASLIDNGLTDNELFPSWVAATQGIYNAQNHQLSGYLNVGTGEINGGLATLVDGAGNVGNIGAGYALNSFVSFQRVLTDADLPDASFSRYTIPFFQAYVVNPTAGTWLGGTAYSSADVETTVPSTNSTNDMNLTGTNAEMSHYGSGTGQILKGGNWTTLWNGPTVAWGTGIYNQVSAFSSATLMENYHSEQDFFGGTITEAAEFRGGAHIFNSPTITSHAVFESRVAVGTGNLDSIATEYGFKSNDLRGTTVYGFYGNQSASATKWSAYYAGAAAIGLPVTTFGALVAYADAAVVYCSDCQVTTVAANVVTNATCKALGSGSVAKRIGGTWKCEYMP